MQIVILEQLEGRQQKLQLPELTGPELLILADALENVRHSCNQSKRKWLGDHKYIVESLKPSSDFSRFIYTLHGDAFHGLKSRDVREGIIKMPDQFFWRFMLLAYEVAQDSTICFKSLERVVKSFGLSS